MPPPAVPVDDNNARPNSSVGAAAGNRLAVQGAPVPNNGVTLQRATSRSQHLTGGAGGSRTNLVGGSRTNLYGSRLGGSHGIIPQEGQETEAQKLYENTYKMKPDKKFSSEAVRRLIEATLAKNLNQLHYAADKVPELTKSIANQITSEVTKLGYDRYKFVVDVVIGENKGQGARVASRCLWDTKTDSYASAYFRNGTLFAVAMVFGLYFE